MSMVRNPFTKFNVGDIVTVESTILMAGHYENAMSQYIGKALRVTSVSAAGYTLFHIANKMPTGMVWSGDYGLLLLASATDKLESQQESKENPKMRYGEEGQRMFSFKRGDFSCIISFDWDSSLTYHEVKSPPDATSAIKTRFLEDAEKAVLNKLDKEEERFDNGSGI